MGLRQRISGLFQRGSRDENSVGRALAAASADRSDMGARVDSPDAARSGHRSDLTQPSERLLLALGGGMTTAGVNVGPQRGRALATAYACVDLRSRLLASLPLKLYRREARGRVEQRDHPAARLFSRRPNGAQTPSSFLAWSQANIDTLGNAVAPVVRNEFAEPVALLPLAPGYISTTLTKSGDLIYTYEGRRLTRYDLLHVPGNDLGADGIWGVSPIARLSETFGLAVATQRSAARSMANDAMPPIAITSPAALKPEQAAAIRDQWMEFYGGNNKGKPAILWGGATPHQLSFNPEEGQLLESRQFDTEEICRIFGVPGELVGLKSASSWGTGIGEKIQGFVKFTIATICKSWEDALDLTLLSEVERDQGFYFAFNLEALLRGDLKSRAEIYKIFREIAAMDVNQIRELEEWTLYADAIGGDPRQPLNNQGGGQPAASAKPAPAVAPVA